jgi:hypothetical protein
VKFERSLDRATAVFNAKEKHMAINDIEAVVFVVSAFALFGGILAWASWDESRRTRRSHRAHRNHK